MFGTSGAAAFLVSPYPQMARLGTPQKPMGATLQAGTAAKHRLPVVLVGYSMFSPFEPLYPAFPIKGPIAALPLKISRSRTLPNDCLDSGSGAA